uniref:Uncharacterized protein n=1 Tax=Astyanax mexicanus TaxID=7994 RepID=A0A3B1K1X1_ASTMX
MSSLLSRPMSSLQYIPEMRNQTKLLMQPYTNWEEYLTPAPLSIAILGELDTDFSINKNPPKDGYKYIRYPDSFRACLMQVCNSGWGAFNEAHKNMDQIRLHTMTVPDHMKSAVKILFQENDEVVSNELVLNLAELLEACVNAEHFYGEELEENKKKLEENKIRKQLSEEAVKRSEKIAKAMEEEMKEALESYKAAMDSPDNKKDWARILSKTYKDITGNTASADEVDKINIYSKSAEILACAEIFQQFVHDTTIDWKILYDQKKKRSNTDFVKGQFTRINSSFEKFPESMHSVMNWQICTQRKRTGRRVKTKQLIKRIKKFTESARAFDSKSKDVTKSPSLTPKPPIMFKEESKSEKKSASERASENLQETRGSYEKSVENMEKNQKELTEILISMRNCELKEIDFNTTIQMLVKGMDAMGRVKEQTLKDFISTSEKTQSLSYNSKLFSKDLLYNQAFQATNIASLVHMISATYTEVSEKYLMDRVSSLGKLMVMDKEKPEFEQERLQLQNSCDEAQKGILRLVLKNKDEFERKTNARLEKIDNELLAILPKAAPEEMKSIQAAVESGFTEEEEDDYA